uniref:Putative secreted protein n=1 Tax=Panstrongylus lignarius TaxID=156445 RepID=A0A224Y4X6_9HEMI
MLLPSPSLLLLATSPFSTFSPNLTTSPRISMGSSSSPPLSSSTSPSKLDSLSVIISSTCSGVKSISMSWP